MKQILIAVILMCCGTMAAQHANIKISDKRSPNEPAICMDPKNPARIVAGSNIANVYVSADTGRTWTEMEQESPYGVWGDPVFAVDTQGSFYHFHLSNPDNGSWIDRIVCQKSIDGGNKWSKGTYTGLSGSKAQDKHWVAVDAKTNAIYVTWTQFDKYGSENKSDISLILFSRSDDGGLTWSEPSRINEHEGDCVDDDNTVEGAVPCIGPQGQIYVAWAGPKGLMFDKSGDGGKTWLRKDRPVSDIPGGWTFDIPGINRCNGLPITVCDLSQGPHRGTVYVNWSDQRHGTDDTDVWLAKSTDGGSSWSKPRRVNSDSTKTHQFFTWMQVDQATGYLWFVYYDRSQYTDNQTDVMMAVSTDGGETFQNFKISESPFVPRKLVFFGDYTNLTVHNNIVRPIWTRYDRELSVWTAIIDAAKVLNSQPK